MGKKSRSRTRDNREKFGGLYNQGATCYLNTLLQTLYMTPEVKEAIIRFSEKTNEKLNKDTSICHQLKALFAQLDAKQTANTHGITRNLGMSQQEIFKQQDIEEYFRLLLNKVATENDGSCNILQIYQIKMINSLMCLNCNIEAPEECILLDIPLPICSFDHPRSFQSVNESFEEFLKVDSLCGDNMCYCETCQKKTETETRYYFESLPQILVLQLKRFEFDCFKMSFTKLHDCIEIPPTLTFQKKNKDIDKTEWHLISMESKEAANASLKKRPSFSLGPQPSKRSRNDESEEFPKLLEDESQQEVQEQEGPLQLNKHINSDCDETHEPRKDDSQQSYTTYELFAICDHSGGYGSGHYVACIKPVSSSKWYCFNDAYVTEMEDFISGAGHGSTVSKSGMACKRSSTAYMLMYRKEGGNSNLGDNVDDVKESNQPMTMRDENGSPELGGMGDGKGNQPPAQNLEDPAEKNATEAKEGNETMGGIEKSKCAMKEKERQSQEMDVVKESGMAMKEKSTEIEEMVTSEKAQGGQCQIGSTENVMREKENVGHLKDSEGKAVENVTGTEKENRNATEIKSVMEENTLNLYESLTGDNAELKEELMENYADEKNIKEENETEEKHLYVQTEKMEDKRTVEENKHTIGQKKNKVEKEEQKRMEQTRQSKGLHLIEIEQPPGYKEQIGVEQNEYHSKMGENQNISEKESQSQEEEKKALLAETKKEEGRRKQTSVKKTSKKQKGNNSDLQENNIEESPETENGKAKFRNKKCFDTLNIFGNRQRKGKEKKTNKKSKVRCIACLRGTEEN
uniref:uncharacterized protein isoform X2 n=1 Tax=Pristiophorus japonicus TaxID=55135 RepID=UPI00398F23CA